ncbi:MAG: hypothetical protein QW171_00140 [Candidatus Bilamarchaeaceae archaeon]
MRRLGIPYISALIILLIINVISAQGVTTEGGNITNAAINCSQLTRFWAGIVGWLNNSPADIDYPVSNQSTPNITIYTNRPNGSYAEFFNTSMILTRLPFKPATSNIFTPIQSDFDENGMFQNFTVFFGVPYNSTPEDPLDTFCNPCNYMTCYILNVSLPCPYIVLNPNTRMAVLKFFNGTVVEPLFVGLVESKPGYNGSFFDFEYIVPALENYYFYLYKREACNISVWIDDTQTTVFPKTGVPYKVEVLVRDNSSAPISNITVRAEEENGRNILYPVIQLGKKFFGYGEMRTNSSGRAIFALAPTRYNIPDAYDYKAYIEAEGQGYYCRQNLSIASYSALTPTYRSSLVNPTYGSQVKASTQNMNSLASTATKWTAARKIHLANVDVYTNGSHSQLPILRAGAPNMLNITVYDNDTLEKINATAYVLEENGHITFVPAQPNKERYENTKSFYTNETVVVIPTRYNNNATFDVTINDNGAIIAVLNFAVNSTLEEPAADEADMDDATYSLISSALQNINSVLINIGKSLSTIT